MKVENCDMIQPQTDPLEQKEGFTTLQLNIGQDMEDMYNQYVLYIMFLFS